MTKTKKLFLLGLTFIVILKCSVNATKETSAALSPCVDTVYPVIYTCTPADNGDYAFRTVPAKQARVQLIPNVEAREKMHLTEINGIIGIHQFFLDHDLVSGFVHRYTQNMFNNLKPGDFVLKFTPDSQRSAKGNIRFIHKNEMATTDSLGRNIAFFRQWRLSEIDCTEKEGEVYVKMDTCTYYTRSVCPAGRPNSGRPAQIPLWQRGKAGERPLKEFSAFGSEDGGTVVMIWESKNEVWFQDIHSSWEEILTCAIRISKEYGCDPAICISDSGPFARKLRANKDFKIQVSDIDALAPFGKRFGAGYGYLKSEK